MKGPADSSAASLLSNGIQLAKLARKVSSSDGNSDRSVVEVLFHSVTEAIFSSMYELSKVLTVRPLVASIMLAVTNIQVRVVFVGVFLEATFNTTYP